MEMFVLLGLATFLSVVAMVVPVVAHRMEHNEDLTMGSFVLALVLLIMAWLIFNKALSLIG